MSRVMVLGAGLGTRLRPLTEELPKPLVPVGDRAILAHIVDRLVAAGFESLVLNTHWLPEAFPRVLAALHIQSQVVHEPAILGTAGGVAGARHLLGPAPILVWNGDILANPPIDALLGGAGEGLCLAVVPRERGQGTVGCGEDGRVVRLRGEVFGEELRGGDYVGVAAVGERCLAELPPQGCLVGDWALPELRRGGTVAAVRAEGGWTDVGSLAAYHRANEQWLRERERGFWVGEGARVEPPVRLERSLVGAGARVLGKGELQDVVVWPGAVVEAPLEQAVVTGRGLVVPIA